MRKFVIELLRSTSIGILFMAQSISGDPLQTIQVDDGVKTTVKEVKTPKGLKIWYVPTPEIPVTTLYITFLHGGEKSVPSPLKGLTDILTSMADEGAGPYDSQGFKSLLIEKNIRFNVKSTADHFYIQCQCTKDHIKDMFDILELALFHLHFNPKALNRVKDQLSVSLQQRLHSEKTQAIDTFRYKAYPQHPYGAGTLDFLKSLNAITPQTLQDHISRWFTQGNMLLTVAGCIEESTLIKEVDRVMGKLPQREKLPTPPALSPQATEKIIVKKMDIPQSVIIFYQEGISRHDPNFYAIYLLCQVLGNGAFKSRLWEAIREKRGLAYSIGSDLSWQSHSHILSGMTATANKNVAQVIQLIREEWKNLQENGVTSKELEFAKEQLMGAYPLGFTSTFDIARVLNNYQQDGLPPDFIKTRNSLIEKVTLEEVNRVAKTFLKPEKLSFIVVGDPEGLAKGDYIIEPLGVMP